MQGRRALFPQGFHCSGMPIKAAADKLVREIELFGENFERYSEEDEDLEADSTNAAPGNPEAKTDLSKFAGSKSKVAAKSGQVKYQFQVRFPFLFQCRAAMCLPGPRLDLVVSGPAHHGDQEVRRSHILDHLLPCRVQIRYVWIAECSQACD